MGNENFQEYLEMRGKQMQKLVEIELTGMKRYDMCEQEDLFGQEILGA